MKEKLIPVSVEAPYYTMNQLTDDTKYIWIIFHGYGQLAKHFIKRFDVFNPKEHFIIAPQGLSRMYVGTAYQKIGASWMTRELRETEINNYLHYLDTVFEAEVSLSDQQNLRVHLLGFSQGVATLSRWAVHRQLAFDQFIIWAGTFPPEITSDQLRFVAERKQAELVAVVGDQDQLVKEETLTEQMSLLQQLTGKQVRLELFPGKHELNRDVLKRVFQSYPYSSY